jgi:hypothetical protein
VPIPSFGVNGIAEMCIFLDDIFVVDITNSSVQLLDNPGFEDSSTALTGWDVWCSYTCGSGSAGSIATGSNCRSSGNCYRGQCRSGGTDFLVQTFSATIGHVYNISFWHQQVRLSSGGSSVIVYVGII